MALSACTDGKRGRGEKEKKASVQTFFFDYFSLFPLPPGVTRAHSDSD